MVDDLMLRERSQHADVLRACRPAFAANPQGKHWLRNDDEASHQALVLTAPRPVSPQPSLPLREHLDRLPFGIVLCDATAHVHWLNDAAERLLTEGSLRVVNSCLSAASPADAETLMQKLAELAAGACDTVRYLRLGEGELALHVAVEAGTRPSSIALTLTSPRRSSKIRPDALMQLFGLTRTEAGLVAALATGSSVEQYAEQRGVSVATARQHLKFCLKKTGTRRQSELVRLVCTSVVAHVS